MEIPEINPSIYSKFIFNNGANGSQWRKDNPFSKCCLENCIFTLTVDPYCTPHTKINSNGLKT